MRFHSSWDVECPILLPFPVIPACPPTFFPSCSGQHVEPLNPTSLTSQQINISVRDYVLGTSDPTSSLMDSVGDESQHLDLLLHKAPLPLILTAPRIVAWGEAFPLALYRQLSSLLPAELNSLPQTSCFLPSTPRSFP